MDMVMTLGLLATLKGISLLLWPQWPTKISRLAPRWPVSTYRALGAAALVIGVGLIVLSLVAIMFL
jgi:uncharacterized protein YjeT (DUF2065 family)